MTHRRIFICDDDHEMGEVFRLILVKHGYDVVFEARCEETIERIISLQPLMIFMNYQMVAHDPAEYVKLIKSNEKISHIPVILFSAMNNIEELAKKTHADGFLKKPFNIDELIAMVNRYIHQ